MGEALGCSRKRLEGGVTAGVKQETSTQEIKSATKTELGTQPECGWPWTECPLR